MLNDRRAQENTDDGDDEEVEHQHTYPLHYLCLIVLMHAQTKHAAVARVETTAKPSTTKPAIEPRPRVAAGRGQPIKTETKDRKVEIGKLASSQMWHHACIHVHVYPEALKEFSKNILPGK